MTRLATKGDLDIRHSNGEAQVIDIGAARRRRDWKGEPWVKIDRLAEEIDYSPRSIYRFVRDGAPVKRLRGGTLRFQVGPFREWLQQRC